MGTQKADQLAELIKQGNELVSTLRGIQKDLKADIKIARELLAQEVDTRVSDIVNTQLKDMYEALEGLRHRNFRQVEAQLNESFRNLRNAAFGKDRDPREYVKILTLVKATVEVLDGQQNAGWQDGQDKAAFIVGRLLGGLPPMEKVVKKEPNR